MSVPVYLPVSKPLAVSANERHGISSLNLRRRRHCPFGTGSLGRGAMHRVCTACPMYIRTAVGAIASTGHSSQWCCKSSLELGVRSL